MSQNKLGIQYKYTDSQIDFLAELKIGFDATYKTVQGGPHKTKLQLGKKEILYLNKYSFEK